MIISETPLRASLFGGGSDFKKYFENSDIGYGETLSLTLDMHVYITVNKKFDDQIRVVYKGSELVDSVNDIKHNIIREALKLVGIDKGIEIIYMADLPLSDVGVGFASSSALAVGVLNALHTYKGEFVTNEILAKEACYIEIECMKQNIGIQDQFAVAFGGFNRYKFFGGKGISNDEINYNGKKNIYKMFDDIQVSVTPLVLENEIRKKLFNNILLYYIGNSRDSKKILKEQEDNIEKNRNLLDEFVRTSDRVCLELQKGNVDIVGTELDKTWNIKKTLSSGISNEKIDAMYNQAKENGAIGGKVLGAGGGGFMLLYCKEESQKGLRTAMSEYKEVNFNIDNEGSRIIFAN